MVEYAGESYTKTPITSDKNIVLKSLNEINYNTIIEGGTAIGMGLATSVNRIKDSKAKSKVIILLTDGVNNSGFIDPNTAAELAIEYGIKIYTIGIGTNGMALSPVGIDNNGKFSYAKIQVEIDENLLIEIAETTGGKYFRATNNKKLQEIYSEINKLEKSDVEEIKYIDERTKREVGLRLHSGKHRLVNRIFDKFGYTIEKMDRVSFAGFTKKNLSRGQWRFLDPKEVDFLKTR